MKNNLKTIINIIKELLYIFDRKQKFMIIGVFIVIILSSVLELLGVTAILPFIQAILTPEELLQNPFVSPFVEMFDINSSKGLMLFCGLGIILLYILKNLFMIFSYYIQFSFSTEVQKELSVKMLKSYMSRPYSYFLSANSSEIIRGCETDTISVYVILSNIFGIITEGLTILLIAGFIIYTDATTAAATLVLMVIVLLGMIVIFKPIAKEAGREYRTAIAHKNQAIYQSVVGVKEIFVMHRKNLFLKGYEDAADKARRAQRIEGVFSHFPDRIIEGICVSGLIGIICIRLTLDENMVDFIPKLATFAMAAFKALPSIGKIISRINGTVYYRLGLANVYSIIRDADEYEKNYIQYANMYNAIDEPDDIQFCNSLKVKDIIWQYDNQNTPILTGASLEIKKGEAVALIGASGSGKTTMADIILGLLRPQKGNVLLDGVDVYAMPKTWAHIVGYVPQSVFLMDDTVRNNIAFGLAAETIDDNKIWEALERAQLKEFIESIPDGLDTIVGERGVKFSGGQRQRVAIARALYNNPDILILDEATAALDKDTESAVMEAIDALQGTITMIIVAHRLTTIRNCDKIYEIVGGKAVLRNREEVLE